MDEHKLNEEEEDVHEKKFSVDRKIRIDSQMDGEAT